ncbi:type II secretion system F family protein [Nocardia sp. bgisy134]|uniref:type II secretion system F family protein n=1 Tax=unclassified Nocardia TaxID=2637762 RepID=UPI003D71727A
MAIEAGVATLAVAGAFALWPGRVGVGRRLRVLGRTGEGKEPKPDKPGAANPLDIASVFDLLAACLRAGLPMASAARVVAAGAPQAVGMALRTAADLLALGAEPGSAWERAARDAEGRPGAAEIDSLARMARRSARSGASLAVAVGELADQHRRAVEDAAAARAERAGVLIGGPLGLCFLPAFLCLGIVPVVIGLAGRVLEGGLL